MSVKLTSYGDFEDTYNWIKKWKFDRLMGKLDKYAQEGVDALEFATPKKTGKTSQSWYYEIEQDNSKITVTWKNSNIVNGVPIAIILQYGHGTRNGGYVQGYDYINPAMKPVFDEISENVWKEIAEL